MRRFLIEESGCALVSRPIGLSSVYHSWPLNCQLNFRQRQAAILFCQSYLFIGKLYIRINVGKYSLKIVLAYAVQIKYCGVPLKAGLYLNLSGRPFLDNGSATRFPVSLSR
jgi:hypothetical protein